MRRITVIPFALILFFPLSTLAQPVATPAPDAFSYADEGAPVMSLVDAGPTDVVAPTDVSNADTTSATVNPPQPVGPAATPPQTVTDALKDVGFMVDAAKNGWWGIFSGFLIMLLLFVADKLVGVKERVGKETLPWLAAALGIAAAIAAQLTTGVHWGQALLQGLTSGLSAVGLWEMVFKNLGTK